MTHTQTNEAIRKEFEELTPEYGEVGDYDEASKFLKEKKHLYTGNMYDEPAFTLDKDKVFDFLLSKLHQQREEDDSYYNGVSDGIKLAREEKDDLLDDMWGLICNVNGSRVEDEKEDWYTAFLRIREKYFSSLTKEDLQANETKV